MIARNGNPFATSWSLNLDNGIMFTPTVSQGEVNKTICGIFHVTGFDCLGTSRVLKTARSGFKHCMHSSYRVCLSTRGWGYNRRRPWSFSPACEHSKATVHHMALIRSSSNTALLVLWWWYAKTQLSAGKKAIHTLSPFSLHKWHPLWRRPSVALRNDPSPGSGICEHNSSTWFAITLWVKSWLIHSGCFSENGRVDVISLLRISYLRFLCPAGKELVRL